MPLLPFLVIPGSLSYRHIIALNGRQGCGLSLHRSQSKLNCRTQQPALKLRHLSQFIVPALSTGFLSSPRYHLTKAQLHHLRYNKVSNRIQPSLIRKLSSVQAPTFLSHTCDINDRGPHKDATNECQPSESRLIIEQSSKPKQRFRPKKRRQRRSSPSERILEAVSSLRPHYYSAHLRRDKLDLSHINPRRLNNKTIRTYWRARSQLPGFSNDELRLHSVLARYLECQCDSSHVPTQISFTEEELELLVSKGYRPQAVEKWASVLLEPKSLNGAAIFKSGNDALPLFILLLFLRRDRITASALKTILMYIQERLLSSPVGKAPQYDHLDWKRLKILVVRLLRHARQCMPDAFPQVIEIFIMHVVKLFKQDHNRRTLSLAKNSDLTYFCNRLLALVSLPANIHPMISALKQEKAQFKLLQFMANQVPALIVTQEGFRSVAGIQLAHAKTVREQEWAQLKSKAWPPWKENRTAMDEDKGREYGISRASRIIRRMYDAGYASDSWEDTAGIYSGWDTDGSPTVQIRKMMDNTPLRLRSSTYRSHRGLGIFEWAARVRATRTRREAWACFLAYEESGLPAHEKVYHAMFEKISYSEVRERQVFEDTNEDPPPRTRPPLLPGDAREVFPEPASSQDAVYIAEPVPSFEELYGRMVTNGVRLSGRFLAFLSQASPTISLAMQVWQSCQHKYRYSIQQLLNVSVQDPGTIASHVPPYIFTEFLRFLCRYDFVPEHSDAPFPPFPNLPDDRYNLEMDRKYPLNYAYALLIECTPRYRPAWTVLMKKLSLPSVRISSQQGVSSSHVFAYKMIQNLVSRMQDIDLELDAEQFQLVCVALQRAASTCIHSASQNSEARSFLLTSATYVRTLFRILTTTTLGSLSSTAEGTPKSNRLQHIPGPAILHSYVRALGILRDYEGLYSFSSWIVASHVEVTARAQAQRGGPAILQRTFIALRAFLERNWESPLGEQARATKELVELVKKQIESVPEWEGWPTIHEAESYLAYGDGRHIFSRHLG